VVPAWMHGTLELQVAQAAIAALSSCKVRGDEMAPVRGVRDEVSLGVSGE
jgi:hypothetical protein